MARKILRIFVILVLALNLAGAMAFASMVDCGMECCRPGDWLKAGTASYEAPSCCDSDRTTCGFETAKVPEAFDKVVCCHVSTLKVSLETAVSSAPVALTHSSEPLSSLFAFGAGPPPDIPFYLSNLTLIC